MIYRELSFIQELNGFRQRYCKKYENRQIGLVFGYFYAICRFSEFLKAEYGEGAAQGDIRNNVQALFDWKECSENIQISYEIDVWNGFVEDGGIRKVAAPGVSACQLLIESECDDLVIPLINEIFGEHYSSRDRIIRRANEHFLEQQGGAEEKRITDLLLEIVSHMDKQGKKYLLECESSSPDGTILIRIFEYAAQIALDDGKVVGEEITVEFPHSAVIYLRSRESAPKQMRVVIRTADGKTAYYIPTIHVRDYSMEDIFRKKLYFLIPFFIFNLENELPKVRGAGFKGGTHRIFIFRDTRYDKQGCSESGKKI